MACKVTRDANGYTYFVPAAPSCRDVSGRTLKGTPEIMVWWARTFKDRRDETLLIRQENNSKGADVVELTLAQVYDLIHALGWAVMRQ